MLRLVALTVSLLVVCNLAACGDPAERSSSAAPNADTSAGDGVSIDAPAPPLPDTLSAAERERLVALDAAIDSLDLFVQTLERIEGPIAAWNHADEAARLLRYLEVNRAAFAFEGSETEAEARYPSRVSRIRSLERRREAELERIGEDQRTLQILFEEMEKASGPSRP